MSDDISLYSVKKAPLEYKEAVEQAEAVSDRFKRRAIKLDPDKKQKCEFELDRIIGEWEDSRSPFNQKLREWNDLAEGVTKVSDFPWRGASQLHVPYPKIKMREIRSAINRTTFRPIPFLMARYAGPDELYEKSRDSVKDIQDFLEDKIKNDTNVHRTLKEGINPVTRDGTAVVQVVWETDLERVNDFKLYSTVDEFITDYPTANDAGVSEERFSEIIDQLSQQKGVELAFEMDLPIYDGPKGYLVPAIDFVHWPVYVPQIKDLALHGKRVWLTDYQIEDYHTSGKFESEDDVQAVIRTGGDVREDQLTSSRDNIEGISREVGTSKEYECYELCWRKDLDGDGVKEKYLVNFARKAKKILRIEKYPIRKGKSTYFLLRFIVRDGRLLGMSLMDDISDLSLEADTIHRMRINSRTITHVPSFKAKNSAKGKFDPSRHDLSFYPGVTFWVDDVESIKQFEIKPVDLSGSVDEETLLYQLMDLVTGASSGLSGQSNPLDPRAPARKQSELLRQSTNRLDDYVENLVDVFSDIGMFMLDLYYQYGPDRIKYYVSNESGELIQKEIERSKLYNPNVRFVVNGTSVFLNPDSEFDRNKEIMALSLGNPVTAQNPRILSEMQRRLLESARIKDERALLPNKEELAALTGGNALLASEQENEIKAKEKLAEERIAQRVYQDEAARKQERELALLDAALQVSQRRSEDAAQVPGPESY